MTSGFYRKAFTMLELVFVIVVVGILAATMAPRFTRDNLQEAADQVVSHLRYTKHLAMVDEKFSSTDSGWYKTRWQVLFANTVGSDNQWAYTIFSDTAGSHTGNPDVSEIAKDPINNNVYLTGGYSAGTIPYNSSKANKSMNLGNKFGIEDVNSTNCGNTSGNMPIRIAFDYLGRPIIKNLNSSTKPYQKSRILKEQCKISICTVNPCTSASSSEKITIAIEPITGYIHIL